MAALETLETKESNAILPEANPAEEVQIETKPVEAKPAEAKPVEAKPKKSVSSSDSSSSSSSSGSSSDSDDSSNDSGSSSSDSSSSDSDTREKRNKPSNIKTKAKYVKRSRSRSKNGSKKPFKSVEEQDIDPKKLKRALKKEEGKKKRSPVRDERKKKYSTLKDDARGVTAEELEAYRLKRDRFDDPMKSKF